jgi:cytochrome b561
MNSRFGPASQTLHWSIALLVLTELALGQWMAGAESRELRRTLLGLHQSNGLLIGTLVLIRVAWRLRVGLPEWPHGVTSRQRQILHCVEGLLYLGMLAMPLTGLSLAMVTGLSISFFGWLEIPSILAESDLWDERLSFLHGLSAKAFFAAILGHAALVLYLDRRASPGFLARMFPFGWGGEADSEASQQDPPA